MGGFKLYFSLSKSLLGAQREDSWCLNGAHERRLFLSRRQVQAWKSLSYLRFWMSLWVKSKDNRLSVYEILNKCWILVVVFVQISVFHPSGCKGSLGEPRMVNRFVSLQSTVTSAISLRILISNLFSSQARCGSRNVTCVHVTTRLGARCVFKDLPWHRYAAPTLCWSTQRAAVIKSVVSTSAARRSAKVRVAILSFLPRNPHINGLY